LGRKVVSFGYGPWRWYRDVTEVWGIYTYEQGELRGAEGEERRGEVRKRMDVPLHKVDKFIVR
jgi:hypothetical protein